jgi:hypothetical protein|tara:strand:+ start:38 stop:442 length:405 start_codon:yes stop_codon:yes gene_type:complete
MPRKTLRQRAAENTDTDFNVNRLRSVTDSIVGTEHPDDLMIELMNVLNESGKVPDSGKYYIFVYNPKTPNIKYDQNPFVAVSDVFSWGFRGINFHWGKVRQYTWDEIVGEIYEVYQSEIKDLQTIPFGNFRLNS